MGCTESKTAKSVQMNKKSVKTSVVSTPVKENEKDEIVEKRSGAAVANSPEKKAHKDDAIHAEPD